jgi:histidine kinase
VTLCFSGGECLSIARRMNAPDLLILDYGLGDCVGPDLLPELESIWGRVVPVVIVSGGHAALLHEAVSNTPWPVLAKPVCPEELRAEMSAMFALAASDS